MSFDASSSRSLEISKVTSAFLWTPPSPPVTKILIPASLDAIIVDATVVAPFSALDTIYAKSLLDVFIISSDVAMNSNSSSVNPIFIFPPIIAVVAGTALIISSQAFAVSIFCGYGIPCEIIVDSRATIGTPSSLAFLTSSLYSTYFFNISLFIMHLSL